MNLSAQTLLRMVDFGDAVKDRTGGQQKVKKRDYLPEGRIPVIDQGQSLIAGYTDDVSTVFSGDLPVVLFGDHTLTLKYIDFPFALGADGVKTLSIDNAFNPKYVFYYWQSCRVQSRGYSRHFKFLREIQLPLIPLSEQRRIVEILDQADALRKKRAKADTKAARILPSLFYKMFGDPTTNPNGWPTERLADLFDVVGGGTPSKAVAEYWSGDIPWVSPKDMKCYVVFDTEDHITLDAIQNSATRLVKQGSVLVVYRSGILAHSFPVAIAGRDLTINQDLKVLSSKGEVTNEYLYGWLTSAKSSVLSCVKKGATVHNVDGSRFLALQIAKPPKSRQETFAVQLGNFLQQKADRESVSIQLETLFSVILHRAFTGDLTSKWREAHMKDLLHEMEQQAKELNLEKIKS